MTFAVTSSCDYGLHPGRPAVTAGTKSQLCSSFFQTGKCDFGNMCWYAHALEELVPAVRVQVMQQLQQQQQTSLSSGSRGFADSPGPEPQSPVSPSIRRTGSGGPSIIQPSTRPLARVTGLAPSNATASVAEQLAAMTAQGEAKSGSKLPYRCRFPHQGFDGSYYELLKLPRSCTLAEIEDRYRAWRETGYKKLRLVNPTRADEVDHYIVQARNVLIQASMREEYDQQLPPLSPDATYSLASSQGSGVSTPGAAHSNTSTPTKAARSLQPISLGLTSVGSLDQPSIW